jgi:hypothetical protein
MLFPSEVSRRWLACNIQNVISELRSERSRLDRAIAALEGLSAVAGDDFQSQERPPLPARNAGR